MTDVQPVQGPIGPEQHRREQKKLGTPEEFKKTYRVQAVDDADAEAQSKKKKQKQGADEEDVEQATQGVPPPAAPLSASPFEVQKPEKKVSGAAPSETPQTAAPYDKSYAPSSSFTAFGDEEDTEDFTSDLPSAPTPSSPVAQSTPSPLLSSTPAEEEVSYDEDDLYTQAPQPSQPQTSSAQVPSPQQNTPSSPPPSTPETAPVAPPAKTSEPSPAGGALAKQAGAAVAKGKKPPQASPLSTPSKEKLASTETKPLPPPQPSDPEQRVKPGAPGAAPPAPVPPKTKEASPEETGLSWHEELPAVSALSSSSGEEKKDDGRKDEEQMAASGATALPTDVPPLIAPDVSGAQAPLPTYTTFSPAVLDMFERMVGTITVLQESTGERMTTLKLTSPNFSSSVFYGAEIVIEEDLHLAPGQYNIKLIGSPEAVQLFQAKSDDLLAAFQSGGYNFKVQRLETAIQTADKPLFKRKEGIGKDSGADAGQGGAS